MRLKLNALAISSFLIVVYRSKFTYDQTKISLSLLLVLFRSLELTTLEQCTMLLLKANKRSLVKKIIHN